MIPPGALTCKQSITASRTFIEATTLASKILFVEQFPPYIDMHKREWMNEAFHNCSHAVGLFDEFSLAVVAPSKNQVFVLITTNHA